MSRTLSNLLPLGSKALEFKLKNITDEEEINLFSYTRGYPFVIAFICNHCPYVLHILDKLVEVGNHYSKNGVPFICISSNDPISYPKDSPEEMKFFAIKNNFQFPYCYDEKQDVAKGYNAACTPDIYLFNHKKTLVYHGQFDNSRPSNKIRVTGKNLVDAINCLIYSKPINQDQQRSIGCNIKWKN